MHACLAAAARRAFVGRCLPSSSATLWTCSAAQCQVRSHGLGLGLWRAHALTACKPPLARGALLARVCTPRGQFWAKHSCPALQWRAQLGRASRACSRSSRSTCSTSAWARWWAASSRPPASSGPATGRPTASEACTCPRFCARKLATLTRSPMRKVRQGARRTARCVLCAPRAPKGSARPWPLPNWFYVARCTPAGSLLQGLNADNLDVQNAISDKLAGFIQNVSTFIAGGPDPACWPEGAACRCAAGRAPGVAAPASTLHKHEAPLRLVHAN